MLPRMKRLLAWLRPMTRKKLYSIGCVLWFTWGLVLMNVPAPGLTPFWLVLGAVLLVCLPVVLR